MTHEFPALTGGMDQNHNIRKILIVSDSRGKLLKPILRPPPDSVINFQIENGATLCAAKNVVLQSLAKTKYTCAYIMAGICSITVKDEGFVFFPFDTKEGLVEATVYNIKTTLKELDDSVTTPIVLCTFPGVDLIRVNNKNAHGHHPQQDILNAGMLEINEYIVNLNLERGFSTPMLSAAVHRCHKKYKDGSRKYKHHLCRLDDGIHPGKSTVNYWKKRLEEDFAQFIFNFEDL